MHLRFVLCILCRPGFFRDPEFRSDISRIPEFFWNRKIGNPSPDIVGIVGLVVAYSACISRATASI